MLLQRPFHTSTSKFLQNCQALIQLSWTHVTHTLMLPNGKQKQKIWLTDSSRTLLNTKEMLPVKLWFPLVLRNKNKTAEIKLFKSLYKRTPQNCGVLFLCRNASAWQSRWSTLRPLPCGGEFVVSRYILHLSYLKIRLL